MTSQETDFHNDIRLKLIDAADKIAISDEFLNAVILTSEDVPLLIAKRNACALHRLFPGGPGWQMKGGDRAWYDHTLPKIKAGTASSLADLNGP